MSSTQDRKSKSMVTIALGLGIGFLAGYLVSKRLYSNNHNENTIKYKKTQFRRFITGHDASGQSMMVLNDSILNRKQMPKFHIDVYNIWRCLNHNEANKENKTNLKDICNKLNKIPLEPNEGGSNFRIVVFEPENEEYKKLYNDSNDDAKSSINEAWKDFSVENDGIVFDKTNKKHPFMHRTKSIDYAIVLYGKIKLVLDKDETTVKAGDFVVQRATNHAWKNCFDDVCIICFILIDADKFEK